jgi:hypothetical protein
LEDGSDVDRETFEKTGVGLLAGAVGAERFVAAAVECEHGVCLFFGIDNPVLADAGESDY